MGQSHFPVEPEGPAKSGGKVRPLSYTVANWHPYSYGPSGPIFNPPAGLKPLKRRYIHELLYSELDDPQRFHEAFLPPAMAAFAAGWPDSFVERLLVDSPALGPVAVKRGPARLQNVLAKAKASAHAGRVNDHVNQLRIHLAEARSLALSVKWPKVDGAKVHDASMTKVFLAILDVADAAATASDLHLGVRRIGLASGTDKSVASRSIRRLIRLGVLSPSRASASARRGDANGYDLHLAALNGFESEGTRVFDHQVGEYLSHDAFRRGVLGPSAFRILVSMSDQTTTEVTDIASAVGLSRGWVQQLLGKMALYRIVLRRGGQWLRAPKPQVLQGLNEAVGHSTQSGKAQRLQATYEAERQHFKYRPMQPGMQVNRDTGEINRRIEVHAG